MNTIHATAIVCAAILGCMLFGLGFAVSVQRARSRMVIGHPPDPADPLHKMVRAHGNTAEYAPFLAVLFLYLGSQSPAAWVLWAMVLTTAARVCIVAGLLLCPTLARVYPLRFLGALGTYVGGLALSCALLL